MAVTCTSLVTASVEAATSCTTGTFSYGANKLLLASVANGSVSDPGFPTVSGLSLTWTRIATATGSDGTRQMSIFRAVTVGSGSGTVTGSQNKSTGMMINVAELSGVDLTTPIIQSGTAAIGLSTHSSLTVTLGAFSNANNATFGAIRKNTSTAVSPGSGFTEIAEWTAVGTPYQSETQFKKLS